jgi:hypothetical protein
LCRNASKQAVTWANTRRFCEGFWPTRLCAYFLAAGKTNLAHCIDTQTKSQVVQTTYRHSSCTFTAQTHTRSPPRVLRHCKNLVALQQSQHPQHPSHHLVTTQAYVADWQQCQICTDQAKLQIIDLFRTSQCTAAKPKAVRQTNTHLP